MEEFLGLSKQVRRGIVGGIAVVYGLGVAFGEQIYDDPGFWDAWLAIGALVVLVPWVTLMVIPWLLGLRSSQ